MKRPASDRRFLLAPFYDEDDSLHERCIAERKAALLTALTGRVLEIGSGRGRNVRYAHYETRWIGVDLHWPSCVAARQAGAANPAFFAVVRGNGESLPFSSQSFDAAVSCLALCSVGRPEAVLREIRRVLRPGGCFTFIEHVAARPGTTVRLLQRALRPISMTFCGGCHPDRELLAMIEEAGFANVSVERFHVSFPAMPFGPHVAGYAYR